MNLNTIVDVKRPKSFDEIEWGEGHAWLAGGTWLFSVEQPDLRRLVDLTTLGWEPLTVRDDGLDIAATCTIRDLYAFRAPDEWTAAPLVTTSCEAFLASFKIWNSATVGGNICMSLPASPMVSLAASLEAVYTIRAMDGSERQMPAVEFTHGPHETALQPGDLLRAIDFPATVLRRRAAFRRSTLTHLGRSTALIVGTSSSPEEPFVLTISAATPKPIQLSFPALPDAAALREALRAAIPEGAWFDDVHGSPAYRQHMTEYYAEQIRAELAGGAS